VLSFYQVDYRGAFETTNWATGWADAQLLAYTTPGAVK
jgi:hypothetical protein